MAEMNAFSIEQTLESMYGGLRGSAPSSPPNFGGMTLGAYEIDERARIQEAVDSV